MLRIAVFDTDPSGRETIKQNILKYTVKCSTDIDVYWFFDRIEKEKIIKYIPLVHIAFISCDIKLNNEIGRLIYRVNEDCRIVYYTHEMRENIADLLCVRPRGFFNTFKNEEAIFECVDGIIEELKNSSNYFYYENRREVILVPMRGVLYFQSNLKYVIIHLKNSSTKKIYTKLSEIEPSLDSDFLRIHKSYIVNAKKIRSVDKSNKIVTLANGETLPISDANYKSVVEYFSERKKDYVR